MVLDFDSTRQKACSSAWISGSVAKERILSLNSIMSSRIFIVIVWLFSMSTFVNAQKFLDDDPLLVDDDRLVDVGAPLRRGLSDYYDFFQNTFDTPGDRARTVALNANTLGEVPDSSWFQNR